MQATLMNFGDNDRVVSSSNGNQVKIGTGQIVSADVHEVHFKMIKDSMARETLIAIPEDMEPTPKLAGIIGLMPSVMTEDEHALIQKFHALLGADPNQVRPSRDMIRVALREVAKEETRKCLMEYYMTRKDAPPSRVNIREQGDERTRQDDRKDGVLDIEIGKAKEAPPPVQKPKKKAIKRERL